MGETIVLPKSGVVLSLKMLDLGGDGPGTGMDVPTWEGRVGALSLWLSDGLSAGSWDVVAGDESEILATREDALRWLDEWIEKTRAALLPPGAIVLRPEEAREVVARACLHAEQLISLDCNCGDQGAGPCGTCKERENIVADAVLKALTERNQSK